MYDTFTLKIDLGNEAMQARADIAEALRDVASKVEQGAWDGTVRDVNGNTVGRFETR